MRNLIQVKRIITVITINDCGIIELLGAQEAEKGITAITPCTCYAIQINKCKDKILNDTKFLRYLCVFLSQKAINDMLPAIDI